MKLEWLAIFSTAFQFAILVNGASYNNPIGISNDLQLIPDNQLSSSSYINSTFRPKFGRLRGPNAWCANTSDGDPFLEIDLGIVYDICAVEVQGRSGDHIITNFSLSSSSNGTNFDGHDMFTGTSSDGDIVENYTLTSTLTTRYIRFEPVSSDVCLRVEVYGVPNGVQVQCERSQMVATINQTVRGDNLTLLDGTCAPETHNDTTILRAIFGKCGTLLTISADNSTAIYRNEVENSDNATFYIICSYERSPLVINVDGTLEFSMEVFRDENFTSRLSDNVVPLGQTLYFQVKVDATGLGLCLHLERCWATPTDNSSHEHGYDLIMDGCPSGDRRFISYFCDDSSNIQRFEVTAFRFSNQSKEQRVYVHCLVKASIASDANSVCKTRCCINGTSQRRRSLEERLEGDFEMQSLIIGPFIFVDRDNDNVDDHDDDDDIEQEGLPVDQKESKSLSSHVVVIMAVCGFIALALIVSLLVLLLVLKGRTVKDVTSDLAVDNMAFDKVDVKSFTIKPK